MMHFVFMTLQCGSSLVKTGLIRDKKRHIRTWRTYPWLLMASEISCANMAWRSSFSISRSVFSFVRFMNWNKDRVNLWRVKGQGIFWPHINRKFLKHFYGFDHLEIVWSDACKNTQGRANPIKTSWAWTKLTPKKVFKTLLCMWHFRIIHS